MTAEAFMRLYPYHLLIVMSLGFAVGFLSFRVKQRWCRSCGAVLTCPDPTYHRGTRYAGERGISHDHQRNAASAAAWRSPSAANDRFLNRVRRRP